MSRALTAGHTRHGGGKETPAKPFAIRVPSLAVACNCLQLQDVTPTQSHVYYSTPASSGDWLGRASRAAGIPFRYGWEGTRDQRRFLASPLRSRCMREDDAGLILAPANAKANVKRTRDAHFQGAEGALLPEQFLHRLGLGRCGKRNRCGIASPPKFFGRQSSKQSDGFSGHR